MAFWGPQRSKTGSVMPGQKSLSSWAIMWCLEQNLVPYKISRGAKSAVYGKNSRNVMSHMPRYYIQLAANSSFAGRDFAKKRGAGKRSFQRVGLKIHLVTLIVLVPHYQKYYELHIKHHKNCKCCPLSPLIEGLL